MPAAANASKIACEPYDVINTQEAKQAAEGNDISFLHVIRPEIGFSADTDPYSEPIYQKAAENLNSLQQAGHLSPADEPSIYIYRQIYQGRLSTASFAATMFNITAVVKSKNMKKRVLSKKTIELGI